MPRTALLALLATILLLPAGCAPRHATLKAGDNALRTGNTWEVNRAVMLAAEQSNNFGVALHAGEQELKERPGNDEARILLARMQSRSGRAEQAMTTLAGVSAEHASSPEWRLEKARACLAANQPAETIRELDALGTDAGQTQREGRKLRAVALDLTGDHRAAQETYRALLIEQDDMNVRYNYGRSLVATADFAEAAAILIPLADNPDYPQARVLASGSLMKSGDAAGARALLEGYLGRQEIDNLMARGAHGSKAEQERGKSGKRRK